MISIIKINNRTLYFKERITLRVLCQHFKKYSDVFNLGVCVCYSSFKEGHSKGKLDRNSQERITNIQNTKYLENKK